jgi:hypothetical protein
LHLNCPENGLFSAETPSLSDPVVFQPFRLAVNPCRIKSLRRFYYTIFRQEKEAFSKIFLPIYYIPSRRGLSGKTGFCFPNSGFSLTEAPKTIMMGDDDFVGGWRDEK